MVKKIYKITSILPNSEQFGLISQMRRASVSISSNIAEGVARQYKKEFINFCYISLGSLSEIETQLLIAKDLDYISSDNEFSDLINDIEILRRKMLNFIKYLKREKD